MCESRDLRVPVGALSTLSLLWQVLAGSQGLFLLSLHIMGRSKAWDGSGWADIHSIGVLHGLKERHKPGLSLHCLNSSCGQVLLLQLSSLSPQSQPYSRQLEGRDGCGGDGALPLLHVLSWARLWLHLCSTELCCKEHNPENLLVFPWEDGEKKSCLLPARTPFPVSSSSKLPWKAPGSFRVTKQHLTAAERDGNACAPPAVPTGGLCGGTGWCAVRRVQRPEMDSHEWVDFLWEKMEKRNQKEKEVLTFQTCN